MPEAPQGSRFPLWLVLVLGVGFTVVAFARPAIERWEHALGPHMQFVPFLVTAGLAAILVAIVLIRARSRKR